VTPLLTALRAREAATEPAWWPAARAAYEADVKRRPNYPDGSPRRTWAALDPVCKAAWRDKR
jgi:hypothetical protein